MDFKPDVLKHELQKDLSKIQSTDQIAYFRADALTRNILKKYTTPGQDALLHSAAISSFEERNRNLTNKFSVPDDRLALFSLWRDALYECFFTGEFQSNVLTLDSCLANAKAGPGASRGTKHTNFLDKMFNSKLTYTKECLYLHYQHGLSERWQAAESLRNATFSSSIVSGSSLQTVPKDVGKRRCICTEPILNMFYQLGAKHVINTQLRKIYRLDISTQSHVNKKLARLGSLNGSNSTLDLKDASDMIHNDLVKQLLHPLVYSTLDLIRSENYTVDGRDEVFNMVSSMGNGFTFSLMTLLLTSLLDVFLRTKRTRYVSGRDGVFGDDIILPSKYATEFCNVLSDFGFVVNLDKSFITGPFRESCGGDFYEGHNVRSIYIKEINNETSIYSAFNRLHYWSIMYGIPIPSALLYLKGLVVLRPIPLHEAEDSGFRMPYANTNSRKLDRNGAVIYHCIVNVGKSRKVGDSETNYHGALIAFNGGYITGQRISIRENRVMRTKVSKRRTPHWDLMSNDITQGIRHNFIPGLTTRELEVSWDSLLEAA